MLAYRNQSSVDNKCTYILKNTTFIFSRTTCLAVCFFVYNGSLMNILAGFVILNFRSLPWGASLFFQPSLGWAVVAGCVLVVVLKVPKNAGVV